MRFTGLRRTLDASAEPVSLVEAKAFLRVDHDDENDLINQQIKAARTFCERETRRAMLEQTWVLTSATMPAKGLGLPNPPLIEVSSVEYRDDDGAWQTLDAAEYEADFYEEPTRLVLTGDAPSTGTHRDAWKVTYVAGYGESAIDVPEDLRSAVLLELKALYEREEETGSLHETVRRLLNGWTVPNGI